jgi:hypothetical protein
MNRTRRENAIRIIRYYLAQPYVRLASWFAKHSYSVQRWGGQHPASARRDVMYDRCICDEPEEEDDEAGTWAPHFIYDTERQDGPDGPPPLPDDWLRLRETEHLADNS